MIVQRRVLAHIGARKASESGKEKGEGVWRAEKEDRKCGAHNGVADGTGQEETGSLTVQNAVFRDYGFIYYLLLKWPALMCLPFPNPHPKST